MEGISSASEGLPAFPSFPAEWMRYRHFRNMNRRYSAAEYAEKCEILRKVLSYPGTDHGCDRRVSRMETEEDFEQSYRIL